MLPLTPKLIDDAEPLRYRIRARDGLNSDSDIMPDLTRTTDKRRITCDILTLLTEQELSEVEVYWRLVLGLDWPFSQRSSTGVAVRCETPTASPQQNLDHSLH